MGNENEYSKFNDCRYNNQLTKNEKWKFNILSESRHTRFYITLSIHFALSFYLLSPLRSSIRLYKRILRYICI